MDEMTFQLQEAINVLHSRMMWSLHTQNKLLAEKKRKLLDEYDERVLARCERYLRDLKSEEMKTYTLSVLANEGFLPVY